MHDDRSSRPDRRLSRNHAGESSDNRISPENRQPGPDRKSRTVLVAKLGTADNSQDGTEERKDACIKSLECNKVPRRKTEIGAMGADYQPGHRNICIWAALAPGRRIDNPDNATRKAPKAI